MIQLSRRKVIHVTELVLRDMTTEQLEALAAAVKAELAKRQAVAPKYVIYRHICSDSSDYHLRKYRHWAKRVTSVDRSKSTGYAFSGDFLSLDREAKVPVGAIVVEYAGCEGAKGTIRAYRATNDKFDKLAMENANNMARFVDAVADILDAEK